MRDWTCERSSSRLPRRFHLIEALATALNGDVLAVTLDAQAIDLLGRLYDGAAAAVQRLVAKTLTRLDRRHALELQFRSDDDAFRLVAVADVVPGRAPSDRTLTLASETVPFTAVRDAATLDALKWLITRLDHVNGHPPPSVIDLALSDATSCRSGGSYGPQSAHSALSAFSGSPDLIVLDEPDEDDDIGLGEPVWTKMIRLNRRLQSAPILLVSDRNGPLPAHVMRIGWSTNVREFRDIVSQVAHQQKLLPISSPQRRYDQLLATIEDSVTGRVAEREACIGSLAATLGCRPDDAWRLLSNPERSDGPPRKSGPAVRIAMDQLARTEVTAENIAAKAFQWSADHLHRWLRENGKPTLKASITAAQLRHARTLLSDPDIDWDTLTEALGMTRPYLRTWARRHDLELPPYLDGNTHLRRLRERVRSRGG